MKNDAFEKIYLANKDGSHIETEEDRDLLKEGALQMGWFMHMLDNLPDSEIESMAKRIAGEEASANRRRYILDGSLEVKREAILMDLLDPVDSVAGSVERQWFREMYPVDKKAGLQSRPQEILQAFEGDPDSAYRELDVLFAKSHPQH